MLWEHAIACTEHALWRSPRPALLAWAFNLNEPKLPAPLPSCLVPHAATVARQAACVLMFSPHSQSLGTTSSGDGHQPFSFRNAGKPKALHLPGFERQQQPAQAGGQLRTSAATGAHLQALSKPWMTCPSSA